LLKRCRAAIESIDSSAEIILYGSRARCEAKPESDYDLLILTDGEVTLKRGIFFGVSCFYGFLVSRKDWNTAIRLLIARLKHPC
jgi:hypothetical protein